MITIRYRRCRCCQRCCHCRCCRRCRFRCRTLYGQLIFRYAAAAATLPLSCRVPSIESFAPLLPPMSRADWYYATPASFFSPMMFHHHAINNNIIAIIVIDSYCRHWYFFTFSHYHFFTQITPLISSRQDILRHTLFSLRPLISFHCLLILIIRFRWYATY